MAYNIDIRNLLNDPADDFEAPKFRNLLNDLQATILKQHRKNHALHLFLSFSDINEEGEIEEDNLRRVRNWLRNLVGLDNPANRRLTSAMEQLDAHVNQNDTIVTTLYLGHSGYRCFGVHNNNIPAGAPLAFREGPLNRTSFPMALGDINTPPPLGIHALLIVAGNDLNMLIDRIAGADYMNNVAINQDSFNSRDIAFNDNGGNQIGICFIQHGEIRRDSNNESIDWFGFQDGFSNPNFFPISSRSVKPNPSLDIVLVPDNLGQHWYSCGSFMTFLKFEQNVFAFNNQARQLYQELNLSSLDRARSYIVGRYPNGRRLEQVLDEQVNRACPFNHHVKLAAQEGSQKVREIVRRGISFDDRTIEERNNDMQNEGDQDIPQRNVGLLFMSFQSDLEYQFEYIVNRWLHQSYSGKAPDPLTFNHRLNKGRPGRFIYTRDDQGLYQEVDYNHTPLVELKSGWYFFAPSISAIGRL